MCSCMGSGFSPSPPPDGKRGREVRPTDWQSYGGGRGGGDKEATGDDGGTK